MPSDGGLLDQVGGGFNAVLILVTLEIAMIHIVGYSILFDYLELTYEQVRVGFVALSLLGIFSIVRPNDG